MVCPKRLCIDCFALDGGIRRPTPRAENYRGNPLSQENHLSAILHFAVSLKFDKNLGATGRKLC
jgi:hypothetical protein